MDKAIEMAIDGLNEEKRILAKGLVVLPTGNDGIDSRGDVRSRLQEIDKEIQCILISKGE